MLKRILNASLIVSLFLVIPAVSLGYTDTRTGNITSSYSASLSSTLLEQKPEVCSEPRTVSKLIGSTPGNCSCDTGQYGGGQCYCSGATETYEDTVIADCLKESVFEDCNLACNHTNNFNYSFKYEVYQNNTWNSIANTQAHKCEEIRLTFTPIADWGASFNKACTQKSDFQNYTKTISVTTRNSTVTVPPTDILDCSGQDDCLSKGSESQLSTDVFGKGVQQIPANWIETTQNSLTGTSANLSCANGVCEAYRSDNYNLSATAPGSVYYGQCRGYDMTVKTPATNIGAVTSTATIPIVNRPPDVTVTAAKTSLMPDEETLVTCVATDQDCFDDAAHKDKITKIRWTCTDINGDSNNCFMWKGQTGIFTQGGFTQDLVLSERDNPYTATALFKASVKSNYIIRCEAWDDEDEGNNSDGAGLTGIGVIPSNSNFCAIISDDNGGDSTVCGDDQEVKYAAYFSSIESINPVKYKWKCSQDDTTIEETTTPNIACSYDKAGTYTPSLSIIGSNGVETQCVNQTSTKIAYDSKCDVSVRKAGSSNNYSDNVEIDSSDSLEAVVNKECLTGGTITWEVTNGTVTKQDNKSAEIKPNSISGTLKIKAQVTTTDGKTTTCSEASASIDDGTGVRFGE